ncbi:hypothetical protein ACJJTC_008750 [Scirpophaga incertulas]
MEFLKNPVIFNDLLNSLNLHDKIYEALSKDDFTEAVLAISKVFENTNKFPPLKINRKSARKSDLYRSDGNIAFKQRNYQRAQEFYNKALLMAPIHSESLVLAYSNRSALFYQVGCFEACLNDINTCLKMNCPPKIIAKLIQRKNKAEPHAIAEKLSNPIRQKVLSQEYLSLKSKNVYIPCASTDIEARVDNCKLPKLIATNNVKVGEVIAVEKAFVSALHLSELNTSCYYCHKMNLNLIPCDNCCVAMFCDETCKTSCMSDYHSIECKVLDICHILQPQLQLALKAVIKLKNVLNTWEKLNEESLHLGLNRIKHSKINEIYDGENIISMLSFKDDDVFIYGQFHNILYESGLVIHYLNQTNSFFPSNNVLKYAAICGFSRLFIYFSMHMRSTLLRDSISSTISHQISIKGKENFGAFALLGKIKHSCNPNVMVVSLNNKAVLVTIQPLEEGTELSISYLGHRIEINMRNTQWKICLFHIKVVCKRTCTVCNGREPSEPILQEKHKRVLRNLENLNVMTYLEDGHFREGFSKCSEALSVMSDVPHSKQYGKVYNLFRRHILYLQNVYCSNVTLMECN